MSEAGEIINQKILEIGKKYNVPIYVKSTFEKSNLGTLINNKNLEDLVINGVAKDDNISKVTVVGLENTIRKTYELFNVLASNNINIDVISQSFKQEETKDIAFTVKKNDLKDTLKILKQNKE